MCTPVRSWRTITVRISAWAAVSSTPVAGIAEHHVHAFAFQDSAMAAETVVSELIRNSLSIETPTSPAPYSTVTAGLSMTAEVKSPVSAFA